MIKDSSRYRIMISNLSIVLLVWFVGMSVTIVSSVMTIAIASIVVDRLTCKMSEQETLCKRCPCNNHWKHGHRVHHHHSSPRCHHSCSSCCCSSSSCTCCCSSSCTSS